VVIGLSVHQGNQIEQVFKEAGAADYVTKDSAADCLYEAIIRAVGAKGQSDAVGRPFPMEVTANRLPFEPAANT
jgi:hypothetical protein